MFTIIVKEDSGWPVYDRSQLMIRMLYTNFQRWFSKSSFKNNYTMRIYLLTCKPQEEKFIYIILLQVCRMWFRQRFVLYGWKLCFKLVSCCSEINWKLFVSEKWESGSTCTFIFTIANRKAFVNNKEIQLNKIASKKYQLLLDKNQTVSIIRGGYLGDFLI